MGTTIDEENIVGKGEALGSIFGKIIRGELPCYKIYQDAQVFAFLDIRPLSPGHTLVIPKREIDDMLDVPRELYLKVMEEAQRISWALQKATSSRRVGLIVQGFEVPHFHVHLVPINRPGDMLFSNARPQEATEMEEMQKKITRYLKEKGGE